jgi:hypothetical protein
MYDPKCHDLAVAFLADADSSAMTPIGRDVLIMKLAQAIQDAIEDWLQEMGL